MEATIQAIYEAFQRLSTDEQNRLLQMLLLHEQPQSVAPTRESIFAAYQRQKAASKGQKFHSAYGSGGSANTPSLTIDEINAAIHEHNWEDELDDI